MKLQQFSVYIPEGDIVSFLTQLAYFNIYLLGFSQLQKENNVLIKIIPADSNHNQTQIIVSTTLSIIEAFNLKVEEASVDVESGSLRKLLNPEIIYSAYDYLSRIVLQTNYYNPNPVAPAALGTFSLPSISFQVVIINQFTVHGNECEIKKLLKNLEKNGISIQGYFYLDGLFKFVPTHEDPISSILEDSCLKFNIDRVIAVEYQNIRGELARIASLLLGNKTRTVYYLANLNEVWGVYEVSNVDSAKIALTEPPSCTRIISFTGDLDDLIDFVGQEIGKNGTITYDSLTMKGTVSTYGYNAIFSITQQGSTYYIEISILNTYNETICKTFLDYIEKEINNF